MGMLLADPAGRNIPAHAGKTGVAWGHCRPLPEHPRARGENLYIASRIQSSPGTSPRTRGKLQRIQEGGPAAGNIPAHAGKTHATQQKCWFSTEHPRARGENVTEKQRNSEMRGTSPRTRGKRFGGVGGGGGVRNIPAHAGKTSFSLAPRLAT